jgi:HAD superfamily hydrolase (TIGR01549 family)
MRFEAVLFDLFNTLVLVEGDDKFYLPSLKKLHRSLVRSGIEVAFEDFKKAYFQVRDKLYVDAEKNLEEPHFNVRISQALQRFGYDLEYDHATVKTATKAFCREFMRYMRLDKDARYVLRRLHAQYKLGVVSNFALPECVEQIFVKFRLRGLFDTVMISGSINKRKPSPEIFQKTLANLDVKASEAIFVGDTPSLDVKGARNAGIKSVLIKRQTSGPTDSMALTLNPREEDEDVRPDKVIRNLKELLYVLEHC